MLTKPTANHALYTHAIQVSASHVQHHPTAVHVQFTCQLIYATVQQLNTGPAQHAPIELRSGGAATLVKTTTAYMAQV